ncbi:MAG: shikimate dehydrogenase [Clostridia bacterium]|nr:shikimate dehydrogenase [Clostridia bacterium]
MEYGLIGEKLTHSFSKEIHSRLGGYDYKLFELKSDELGSFFGEKDFRGINVTIPYKVSVLKYLDYIDDAAKVIGAVNTVINREGKLYGYNTDAFGLFELIKKSGIDISDKKVLILGGGGTSRTAFYAAKQLGAVEVYGVSRTKREGFITYGEAVSLHFDAEIIINTTPVGMYPDIENCPIDISAFRKLKAVFDVIYNPLKSRLLLEAESRGIYAAGGLYMLVMQACRSAELFSGGKIDDIKAGEVYKRLLKEKKNIVLVGMPSAGKTEIGKMLSASLNMTFIDTDAEIEKATGKTPAQIIKCDGEAVFRKIESDTIRKFAVLNHSVLATGGGAVLNKENVLNLKANGRVYYIDRPLDLLITSPDRPLSSSKEAIAELYEKRRHLYESAADKTVRNDTDLKAVIEIIREDFLL